MALGLPQSTGGGGDRNNILKYDARAGRLFRVDRSQDAAGNWINNPVEITRAFQAIMDLEQIETGWLHFPKAAAPDIRTVLIGEPLPDRPSKDHKSGFRVMMKLGKDCGGDVREMAANAGVSIAGMDALHDAYTKGAKDNPGKLPVVVLKDTVSRVSSGNGQSSTNYEPVWDIVKWIDRPADLPKRGAAPPPVAANEGQQQPVTQARTTSQEQPAPAASEDQF